MNEKLFEKALQAAAVAFVSVLVTATVKSAFK